MTEEKLYHRREIKKFTKKIFKPPGARDRVSRGSAHTATKLLKLKPYIVMVVHALQPVDHETRVRFCNWVLQNIASETIDANHIFFTDEAWFNLHGHVNSQNNRIWSSENPHLIHQISLHGEKVGV